MRFLVCAVWCAAACGCAVVEPAGEPVREATAVTGPSAANVVYKTVKRTICLMQAGDYHGVTDVDMNGVYANENFYYGDTFEVYGDEVGNQALLRFDEIALPAGAHIEEAFIMLTMERKAGANFGIIYAHRMLHESDFQQVTWDYADLANSVKWGADSQALPKAGVDYEAEPAGTIDSTGIFAGDAARIDVTDAVGYWVERPDKNYGLLLRTDRGKMVGVFHSSESPNVGSRPRLYVTYTLQIAITPSPQD